MQAEASKDMGGWLFAGIVAFGYAVFAHYASAANDIGAWAILLAIAPMLVVGLGVARESRRGLAALLLALAGFGALVWLWPRLHNPVAWLYFLQHVGINSALALFFGRTLTGGHKPLITALAAVVHKVMTPELERYTRQVTIAWTLFFAASAGISAGLFFFGPVEAWSVFANILTVPLIALMFLVEYEVRKRVLPERDLVGLKATVHAFRDNFRR